MSDDLHDLFRNEVIRASAGTGKTFALSNRFLRLLASGVHPETILATTFTRKGAGEILDRIVRRLAAAALSDESARQLSGELNWPGLDRSRSQQLLRELMKNLHRLQISTLDAFFYRIAQAFKLELGLPTDWQIVDALQLQGMQNRVIQDVLRQEEVIDLLHLLTQGEADRRVAQLIRMTIDNLYPIYLETTREAWNRLPEPAAFNPNRNFDDVVERLLSIDYPDKRQRQKIEKEMQLVQAQDWLALAESSLFARIADGTNSYFKPLPEACVAAYADLIRHCRDYFIATLIKKNLCTYGLLDQFGQRFELSKTVTGQLRFDDITRHLEEFISGRDTTSFSYRLDHKVDHLLLDEFQDTSLPQWRVLSPFARRTTEDDAKRSFFCVGDLKQAIFGWRGGVAEIFDEVESQLANMSKAQPLTRSYRSSPVVIDMVNQIFGQLNLYQTANQTGGPTGRQ